MLLSENSTRWRHRSANRRWLINLPEERPQLADRMLNGGALLMEWQKRANVMSSRLGQELVFYLQQYYMSLY